MADMSVTITPKTDQLNADDLIVGPLTLRITKVTLKPGEQPAAINFEGDRGKPYKPCLGMRRVMVRLWGKETDNYVGRRLTVFRDDEVTWGGAAIGGIRISHMSHIGKPQDVPVTISKKKRIVMRIDPLSTGNAELDHALAELRTAATEGMAALQAAWLALPVAMRRAVSPTGCPEDLKEMAAEADRVRAEAPPSDLGEINAALATLPDDRLAALVTRIEEAATLADLDAIHAEPATVEFIGALSEDDHRGVEIVTAGTRMGLSNRPLPSHQVNDEIPF